MVDQDVEYRGHEKCYIVTYYGVLCTISILCWNMFYVRLQL